MTPWWRVFLGNGFGRVPGSSHARNTRHQGVTHSNPKSLNPGPSEVFRSAQRFYCSSDAGSRPLRAAAAAAVSEDFRVFGTLGDPSTTCALWTLYMK